MLQLLRKKYLNDAKSNSSYTIEDYQFQEKFAKVKL